MQHTNMSRHGLVLVFPVHHRYITPSIRLTETRRSFGKLLFPVRDETSKRVTYTSTSNLSFGKLTVVGRERHILPMNLLPRRWPCVTLRLAPFTLNSSRLSLNSLLSYYYFQLHVGTLSFQIFTANYFCLSERHLKAANWGVWSI